VDAGLVATGPRWDIAGIRRFMIVFGLIGTAFDLVAVFILSGLFGTGEALFQTTWFVISLLPEIAVVLVLGTRAPAWSGRPASARCPPPSASSPCRRPFS
jgi:Mg2+-importing ATPase